MSLFKKLSAIVIVSLFGSMPVLANLPNTIWAPIERYTAAFESNNLVDQIAASKEIISIMEPQPVSESRTNVLLNHYYQTALAYMKLQDYANAYKYFQLYLPFGQSQSDDTLYAETALKLLQPSIDVFQKTAPVNMPYFNAKFEPENGVLYGSFYSSDPNVGVNYAYNSIRNIYPSEESSLLVYLEFGQDVTDSFFTNIFNLAREQNKLIVLAWNTMSSKLETAAHHNYPLYNISPVQYIDNTLAYLSGLGLDILIRFGAEMNVGESGVDASTGQLDPAGFIESFKLVSSKAKQYNNLGMIWSPNDFGSTNTTYEMFYPGNEFVDWVGISAYPKKYFLDQIDPDPNTRMINEVIFYSGEHANPVKRVEPIIEFMQNNHIAKPIFITETGFHHFITELGEETTNWAIPQMQKSYTELLYKYPQIKGINYFNNSLSHENSHGLFDNPTLLALYNELVSNDLLIKYNGTSSNISYKNITSSGLETEPIMEIRSSVYYPFANDANDILVEYWSSNILLGSSSTPPYTVTLRNVSDLIVKVKVNGQVVDTKQISKNPSYIPGSSIIKPHPTSPPANMLPGITTPIPPVVEPPAIYPPTTYPPTTYPPTTYPPTDIYPPTTYPPTTYPPTTYPPTLEPSVPSLTRDDLEYATKLLYREIDDQYDVEWLFDITLGRDDNLLFDISFEGEEFLESYLDITEKRLEGLIYFACETLHSELGSYYPIEGYVYDEDTDKEYLRFYFEDGELKLEEILMTDDQADDILDLLEDQLEESLEMEWEFRLETAESSLLLTLEFDGDDYLDTFKDLREGEIVDFVNQAYNIISTYLENDEVEIEGVIFDYDDETALFDFYIDEDGDIELAEVEIDYSDREDIEYDDRDIDHALEELEDNLSTYLDIEWEFEIKDKDGYVLLDVYFDGDDYLRTYRSLRNSQIREFLAQAYDIIIEELDDNYLLIEGTIIDYDNETDWAEFVLTDGEVDLETLEDESDYLVTDLEYDILDYIYDYTLALTSPTGTKADVEIKKIEIDQEDEDEATFIVTVDFDYDERQEDVWFDILIEHDQVEIAETLMQDIANYLSPRLRLSIDDNTLNGILVDSHDDEFLTYDASGFYY